jgi:hypothetical protein
MPRGSDAVELVWEVNDLRPYDGRPYRAHTATFTARGQKEFLKDKSFDILASLDGMKFVKIATVRGPTNTYLHKGVNPGWLYYYKVRALDETGKLLAESPTVMGAAGKNLVQHPGHEELPLGKCDVQDPEKKGPEKFSPPKGFTVVKGARLYSDGKQILKFDPAWANTRQISFYGNVFPVSPDKIYLQGGWVRAPGNVWYGRYFYDKDKRQICWGYSAPAIRKTPEWTYTVQLLLPDTDGSGFRRPKGRSMAVKQWMFPTDARFVSLFVVAFGPGECDDHWILEVKKAPRDARVKASKGAEYKGQDP